MNIHAVSQMIGLLSCSLFLLPLLNLGCARDLADAEVNRAPRFTSLYLEGGRIDDPGDLAPPGGPFSLVTGEKLNLGAEAIDPDGDPITYQWSIPVSAGCAVDGCFTADPSVHPNGIVYQAPPSVPAPNYVVNILATASDPSLESDSVVVQVVVNTNIGDAYELDNSTSRAKPISVGDTQTRSIVPAGDRDYIKLVLSAEAATLTIEITDASGGDPNMWLFDPDLNMIAFDDDSGAGDCSLISVSPLPAGTYYIEVQEEGNDAEIPAYTIVVTAS